MLLLFLVHVFFENCVIIVWHLLRQENSNAFQILILILNMRIHQDKCPFHFLFHFLSSCCSFKGVLMSYKPLSEDMDGGFM